MLTADQIGAVESVRCVAPLCSHQVKAASDIYSPVSGIVVEANEKLNDEMTLVNKSPEEEGAPLSRQCTHTGWFAKIKLTDPAELEGLLSEEAYKKLLE
jgi:glycine cleavage system H protein